MENKEKIMKKKYISLLRLIILFFVICFVLNKMNFEAQTYIGKALGALAFILPIEILLCLVGHDKDLKLRTRIISKIIFWFIIVCYLGAGVALLLPM